MLIGAFLDDARLHPTQGTGIREELSAGQVLEHPQTVRRDPHERLGRRRSAQTSVPSTRAEPDVGLIRPVAIDKVVVLPAPLGPTRP